MFKAAGQFAAWRGADASWQGKETISRQERRGRSKSQHLQTASLLAKIFDLPLRTSGTSEKFTDNVNAYKNISLNPLKPAVSSCGYTLNVQCHTGLTYHF